MEMLGYFRRFLFGLSVALVGKESFVNGVAPQNPHLARGGWPIAHHDSYAQASTLLPGPRPEATHFVEIFFDRSVAGALTLLFTPDGNAIWGSSFSHIFKVGRSTSRLEVIDSVVKDSDMKGDLYRGIYSILSESGVFFVCGGRSIAAYTDEVPSDSLSAIRPIGKFVLPEEHLQEGEHIRCISMLYDGHLVFVTNRAKVGIVPQSLDRLVALKSLSFGEFVDMSNSIAVDEFGGIYVVTSKYLHRVLWMPSSQSLNVVQPYPNSTTKSHFCDVTPNISGADANLRGAESDRSSTLSCVGWSAAYDIEEEPFAGRPTKVGSGTTPSLLKDGPSGRLFVVIADGSRQQKVVIFDAEDGNVAGQADVTFKHPSAEEASSDQDEVSDGNDSFTEQSVLVYGNRLVVVQNALTEEGRRVNEMLEAIDAPTVASAIGIPDAFINNMSLLPVALGDAPSGLQQFLFDPKNPGSAEHRLTTTWVQEDSGCPNSIPTMSASSGAIYCVGKTQPLRRGSYPGDSLNKGSWSIQAIDWETGEILFNERTGGDIRYNSLYAATQIGPDGEIYYGALGGIVRLKESDSRVFDVRARRIAAAHQPAKTAARSVQFLTGSSSKMPSLNGVGEEVDEDETVEGGSWSAAMAESFMEAPTLFKEAVGGLVERGGVV